MKRKEADAARHWAEVIQRLWSALYEEKEQTSMNHRERMIRTVHFQEVDQLPCRHAYGLMPGVLENWYAEGLPSSVKTEKDIYEYFGFPTRSQPLPLNVGFDPPFETKVIEENEEHQIAVDSMGRTTRVMKRYASIPLPMEYPVKDASTWRDYKRRLTFSPQRIGADLEQVVAANRAAGRLNSFESRGFYWFPRDLMGDEGLCMAYYQQPDLVRDILKTWCGLIEQVLATALEWVRIDCIHFGEDMAYRNASMVSPVIFKMFIKPYYDRIHRLVERYEVPLFSVDTDGCLQELIHWFSECGVNLIGPNEVQAGNDIRTYRRQFGQRMAYDGGLDKRILTQGRDAIDVMLERTIPFMKGSGGGWVVCLDHRVIQGTPLADFQYYLDRVRDLGRF